MKNDFIYHTKPKQICYNPNYQLDTPENIQAIINFFALYTKNGYPVNPISNRYYESEGYNDQIRLNNISTDCSSAFPKFNAIICDQNGENSFKFLIASKYKIRMIKGGKLIFQNKLFEINENIDFDLTNSNINSNDYLGVYDNSGNFFNAGIPNNIEKFKNSYIIAKYAFDISNNSINENQLEFGLIDKSELDLLYYNNYNWLKENIIIIKCLELTFLDITQYIQNYIYPVFNILIADQNSQSQWFVQKIPYFKCFIADGGWIT